MSKNVKKAVPDNASATPATTIPAPIIRILKVASAESLSGKSTLTYHVGCNEQSELFFRVICNSSSGYHSKELVSLNAIQQALAKAPDQGALTSFLLRDLFVGRSTNTPGFIFAVLLAEGLVKPSGTVDRCYECTDGKAFFAEAQALIESGINLDADTRPKKLSKKKPASETAPSAE